MITVNLDSLDERPESFEFWANGRRLITISMNDKNLSLQMPGSVDPRSIKNGVGSFFLRTKDRS